jgi:hypothetical protein
MEDDEFEEAEANITIREWCQREHISESTFHRQRRDGLGPKTVRYGRARRITESRASYHRRMAALEASRAKKLEHARVVAQTKAAVAKRWAKQKDKVAR